MELFSCPNTASVFAFAHTGYWKKHSREETALPWTWCICHTLLQALRPLRWSTEMLDSDTRACFSISSCNVPGSCPGEHTWDRIHGGVLPVRFQSMKSFPCHLTGLNSNKSCQHGSTVTRRPSRKPPFCHFHQDLTLGMEVEPFSDVLFQSDGWWLLPSLYVFFFYILLIHVLLKWIYCIFLIVTKRCILKNSMTQLHRPWDFLSLSLLLLISPKIFQWVVLHDEQSVQHSAPEVLLIILHSFL